MTLLKMQLDYIYIYIYIYQPPLLGQDMTPSQFLSGV